MKAFDEAWNVLKMGTYEEEEEDMRRLRAIREALKRGPPYGNQTGKPEPFQQRAPAPYDNPYRNPPTPNDPKRPYGGSPPDDMITCQKCGYKYKRQMTGMPSQCPRCDMTGNAGTTPNPYGPPPGAPTPPFQPKTIDFPEDFQRANMSMR